MLLRVRDFFTIFNKQIDKMAEDQADIEHISLHSCLKNTTSDTDLTEHKLRPGMSP